MALSRKQRQFAAEYVNDLNGAQAAIRAGYSAKTARQQATRLLSKAHMVAEVQRLQAERLAAAKLTAERILEEIRRVALSDVGNLFDADGVFVKNVHELPPEVRAAIASVEVIERTVPGSDPPAVERVHKVRLWDKGKHFEMAAKHLALLVDKSEVHHSGEVVYRNMTDDELRARALRLRDEMEREAPTGA